MAEKTPKENNEKLKETVESTNKTIVGTKLKTCFVIMPISDPDGYESGHFQRVYDYLIKPACEKAGFKPIRADENTSSNHIIIEILKQILDADMAICDLSSRNANVFYELAIRHAFDKPVTLIKDEKITRSPFDIQTLRYISYDSKLRVDQTEKAVPQIAQSLSSTYKDKTEKTDSVVYLLGIQPAQTVKTEISNETSLILETMQALTNKMNALQNTVGSNRFADMDTNNFQVQNNPTKSVTTPQPFALDFDSQINRIQFTYTGEENDNDIKTAQLFIASKLAQHLDSINITSGTNTVSKKDFKILDVKLYESISLREVSDLVNHMEVNKIYVPPWGASPVITSEY